MHAARQPKISPVFTMFTIVALLAGITGSREVHVHTVFKCMMTHFHSELTVAMCTDAAGTLNRADPAGSFVDGSSGLDASLKALVLSCLLDCNTSSQNVPALQTLHYSTADSLLAPMNVSSRQMTQAYQLCQSQQAQSALCNHCI